MMTANCCRNIARTAAARLGRPDTADDIKARSLGSCRARPPLTRRGSLLTQLGLQTSVTVLTLASSSCAITALQGLARWASFSLVQLQYVYD